MLPIPAAGGAATAASITKSAPLLSAGAASSAGAAEAPLVPKAGPRQPPALLQLDAALAEERAGIDDMLEQRAAELLQDTAAPTANSARKAANGAHGTNGSSTGPKG